MGQYVRSLLKHGLIGGISSSQGEETDSLGVEVDLDSCQSVEPMGIDLEVATEQLDASFVVGPSDVDDRSSRRLLEVEAPSLGKGLTWRSCFDSGGSSLSIGCHESGGTGFETAERLVFEATPDFGLPSTVETFDGGLEAGLVGRHEDRCDAEAQAETRDTSHHVAVLFGALEAIVVVELSVSREPHKSPMFEEFFDHGFGDDIVFGPNGDQAAEEGNTGQNREMRAFSDGQAFDGVEAVQLGLARGDLREIPAGRRRRPSLSPPPIEDSSTLDNPTARTNGGAMLQALVPQFAMNGSRSVLAQGAAFAEPLADGEDAAFDVGRSPMWYVPGPRGSIFPVDTIQPFSLSSSDPSLDGVEGDTEVASGLSHRASLPDSSHHGPSLLGCVFASWESPTGRFPSGMTRPRAKIQQVARNKLKDQTVHQQVLGGQRPRETFEGSRGTLFPSTPRKTDLNVVTPELTSRY